MSDELKNCKNCLNSDICAEKADDIIAWIAQNLTDDDECKFYKDKSRIVELPCAFGDTAYEVILLNDTRGFIVNRKVVGYHTGDLPTLRGHKREEYLIIYHEATHSISHIDYKRIGKTVFFTREEAVEALREFNK